MVKASELAVEIRKIKDALIDACEGPYWFDEQTSEQVNYLNGVIDSLGLFGCYHPNALLPLNFIDTVKSEGDIQ